MPFSFEQWLQSQKGLSVNDVVAFERERRGTYDKYYSQYLDFLKSEGSNILDKVTSGNMSGLDAQGALSSSGINLTPEQNEYLNNVIATDAQRTQFEQTKALQDNSYLSAAKQLESLGLNPASVLSTGGASAGTVGVADTSSRNLAQEKAITQFNQRASTVRTILGIASGLASAGIGGGALYAARNAAAKIAASASHSALSTIRYTYGRDGDLLSHYVESKRWD